jgi:hypothetical protein
MSLFIGGSVLPNSEKRILPESGIGIFVADRRDQLRADQAWP